MKKKRQNSDEHPNKIGQLKRRICSQAMMSALLVAFLFLLIHEKAIAKGLLLGTVFSIINFLLLGTSIPMAFGRSRAKAGFIGLASILSRYLVLSIPMIMAMKLASFNFVAVVVGIFAVQIVTLVDYILVRPFLEGKSFFARTH